VHGDPRSATAQLLAGWLSSRCGCPIDVEEASRIPGPSGVDAVTIRLDQGEEVRVQVDRRGGAVISQPFRPDSSVALPDRTLGDLLGEELRRLDPDEPYSEALEAATGTSGLAGRSPVREYVWFDPAEQNGNGADGLRPVDVAPAVPADSRGTDDVAQQGVDEPDPVAATAEAGDPA
jgi:glucose-6-phosphate dehydrogenase assembly protein OpcA